MKHLYFAVFVAALVLLTHPGAWSHNAQQWAQSTTDYQLIYKSAQDTTPRETVKWWRGAWIHPGSAAYRPLSAYVNYAQAKLIEAGKPSASVAINVALFCVMVFCAGGIAYTLTRQWFAAIGAALILAPMQTHWPLQADSLAWFPYSDNLLCLSFFLASLWAFVAYLQNNRARCALLSWLLLIGACFSKEYAYILPAMALAAVWLAQPQIERKAWQPWAVAGVLCVTVIGFVLYRQVIIDKPYGTSPAEWLINQNYLLWQLRLNGINGASLAFLVYPLSALLGVLQIVAAAYGARYLWKARGHQPLLMAALWFALAFVPLLGMPIRNHLLLFPWALASVLIGSAVAHSLRVATQKKAERGVPLAVAQGAPVAQL